MIYNLILFLNNFLIVAMVTKVVFSFLEKEPKEHFTIQISFTDLYFYLFLVFIFIIFIMLELELVHFVVFHYII